MKGKLIWIEKQKLSVKGSWPIFGIKKAFWKGWKRKKIFCLFCPKCFCFYAERLLINKWILHKFSALIMFSLEVNKCIQHWELWWWIEIISVCWNILNIISTSSSAMSVDGRNSVRTFDDEEWKFLSFNSIMIIIKEGFMISFNLFAGFFHLSAGGWFFKGSRNANEQQPSEFLSNEF